MTATGGRPPVLIASGGWPTGPWAEALAKLDPDRTIYRWPEEPPPDPAEIGYLLAWKPDPQALEGLANLRLICSLGAGVDHLAGHALPDVPIVRVIDEDLTGRMTEWVVLQVLLHHRRHLRYEALQAAHRWEELPQPRARDVRVGVMGLGVLGTASAEALVGLGFDVAGWSRTPKDVAGVATFAGDDGLDVFLARTDILVCLLPLTDATRGLLARPLFGKLARDRGGPFLINAGRGALQVEDDVVAALEDGMLVGASLDVFVEEPLPPESPLWDAPNLVITPHVSAPSTPAALIANIHRQILRYEAGETPGGLIDRSAGY